MNWIYNKYIQNYDKKIYGECPLGKLRRKQKDNIRRKMELIDIRFLRQRKYSILNMCIPVWSTPFHSRLFLYFKYVFRKETGYQKICERNSQENLI